jgi:hypothetical protein
MEKVLPEDVSLNIATFSVARAVDPVFGGELRYFYPPIGIDFLRFQVFPRLLCCRRSTKIFEGRFFDCRGARSR